MGMFFLWKVVNGKPNAWCLNPRTTAKFLTHENLNFYNFYLPQLHCNMFSPFKRYAFHSRLQYNIQYKGKGKAVPLQAWSGPEGSRK